MHKSKISNKNLLVKLGIISVLFLIEIILVVRLKIQINIVITLFLYPLLAITMILLLKNDLSEKKVFAYYTQKIANFIYYSHPICITILSIIGRKVAHVEITETPMFLMTSCLTTMAGFILLKIDNKRLNEIFL